MVTALRYWKTDFSLIIYSPSSTNPENLVKISLVDFETTGLTGILKIIFLKRNRSRTYCWTSLDKHAAG